MSDLVAAREKLGSLGLVLDEADGALWIRGNTYDHRDSIKATGAVWSRDRQAWRLPSPDAALRLGTSGGLAEQAAPPPTAAAGWGSKHYHGHRDRLRTRFQDAGSGALADYELLEMLLFFSIYRRDTKEIAKKLIERFGGLGEVLAAEPERYAECLGLVPLPTEADPERRQARDDDLRFTQVLLKAIHDLLQRVRKQEIQERPVISAWSALIDYLSAAMQHETAEHFRILFLDRKNILIRDEVQSRGTVDHTPLYPREVVKRALELGASAIIMVHNHPSGDPTPSPQDIDMTRQVIAALKQVGIKLHDHIVVGKNRHASLRSQKLI